MKSRLLTVVLLVLLALAVGHRAAPADDAVPTLRGHVTEVKGGYCKIDLTAAEGLTKGTRAELRRGPQPGKAVGHILITAVAKDYSVGRVEGQPPKIGDLVVVSPPGAALPAPPAVADPFEDAIGQQFDIDLKSGTAFRNVKLIEVIHDKATGRPRLLRIEDAAGKKTVTLAVSTLARIARDGQPIELPAAGKSVSATRSPPKTKTGGGKTRRQLLSAARRKQQTEAHRRWLARLEARGIKPWPELTEAEHQATLDKHRELMKEVGEKIPGMQLYETEQFNFFSNIPPQQCGPYVASLDAMYEMMCKMYRVDPTTRVWRGKALVVAFLEHEQFLVFETTFMKFNPGAQIYGLCHSKNDGEVIISCYRGDRPAEFGQMLVHETSHGFIHRYKTPIHLPSWVNEGMADYIGQAMVPASKSVKRKERSALAQMQKTHSLGGNFFADRADLDVWQYGAASSLADFMIRTGGPNYAQFIEGMKEGLTWQESLEKTYAATPEQLLAAYGEALNIPDLRP